MEDGIAPVIDAAQEKRIRALHRGYLYQHLYVVGCLFLAARAGAECVLVEHDEDLEIILPARRIYVQVKTRSKPIIPSDIDSTIARFERLREEHAAGRRTGMAHFVVVADQPPGPVLSEAIARGDFRSDVAFCFPGQAAPAEVLPSAWSSISDALRWCIDKAASIPHRTLSPDTLVWKLAGRVLVAAAGSPPHADHAFLVSRLPELFEQLLVQLQDFPDPPQTYRPQLDEPELDTGARVRLISGFSGAGKTAWASQAALHAGQNCAYYDCTQTPGEALASSLVRELAAKLVGAHSDAVRQILLPGAYGLESLRALDHVINDRGLAPIVVLDNAHRIPADNLRVIVGATKALRFVLLCQPTGSTKETISLLGLGEEMLKGWSLDDVAHELTGIGAFGSASAIGRLRAVTAGMPLYVKSAGNIALNDHGGDVGLLCDALETRMHVTQTAQEVILSKIFEGLPAATQDVLAVLSLADVTLSIQEAKKLLTDALQVTSQATAEIIRDVRPTGVLQVYGGQQLKVHDAIRMIGLGRVQQFDAAVAMQAKRSLKEVLALSIAQNRDTARFALFTRMLVETSDIKTLVELIGEEMFHELGVAPAIWESLETAIQSPVVDPEQRFWALDGLVFSAMKYGRDTAIADRLSMMEQLVERHGLGDQERMSLMMKRMLFQASQGDGAAVLASIEAIDGMVPNRPDYQRVFRYNAAHALYRLNVFDTAFAIAQQLISEYYDILGITPQQIIGLNHRELWELLEWDKIDTAEVKHLADALELFALAGAKIGRTPPLARIHALKFYSLVGAIDSVVRVGQDAADEFVHRNDYIGAKQILEENVLPHVFEYNMLDRVLAVRSQYAVVLAYCGEVEAAEREMARLDAYAAGFTEPQRLEIARQKELIAQQRVRPVPPQVEIPRVDRAQMLEVLARRQRARPKVGRNDPCPCGSGRKFKRCHGT